MTRQTSVLQVGVDSRKTERDLSRLEKKLDQVGQVGDRLSKIKISVSTGKSGVRLSQLRGQLEAISKASKNVGVGAQAANQGIESTANTARRGKKEVSGLERAMMELRRATNRSATITQGLTAAVRQLKTAIPAAQTGLRKIGQEMHLVGTRAAKTTAKVSQFKHGLISGLGVGITAPLVSRALHGTSAALTSSFGLLDEFGSSMSAVQAVSRSNAEQTDELRETAKKLGAETKFTAVEAADAMQYLGMAGYDANSILSAIPDTLSLAAAAGMDLASTADIMTNIMAAFSLEAHEATRAADVLAATAVRSNTTVYELGNGMRYAGAVAAATGVEMETVAASMGILANNGLKASMAGTGVRKILASLSQDSAKARKVTKELGLTLEDLDPSKYDLLDIIDKLARSGINTQQTIELFGIRGAPAMLTLIKDRHQLRELHQDLLGAAGEAKRIAEMRMDNLLGDFLKLKSAAQGVFVNFGDAGLEDFLRSSTQGMTGLASRLAKFNNSLRDKDGWNNFKRNLDSAYRAITGSLYKAFAGLEPLFNVALGALNAAVAVASATLKGLAAVIDYIDLDALGFMFTTIGVFLATKWVIGITAAKVATVSFATAVQGLAIRMAALKALMLGPKGLIALFVGLAVGGLALLASKARKQQQEISKLQGALSTQASDVKEAVERALSADSIGETVFEKALLDFTKLKTEVESVNLEKTGVVAAIQQVQDRRLRATNLRQHVIAAEREARGIQSEFKKTSKDFIKTSHKTLKTLPEDLARDLKAHTRSDRLPDGSYWAGGNVQKATEQAAAYDARQLELTNRLLTWFSTSEGLGTISDGLSDKLEETLLMLIGQPGELGLYDQAARIEQAGGPLAIAKAITDEVATINRGREFFGNIGDGLASLLPEEARKTLGKQWDNIVAKSSTPEGLAKLNKSIEDWLKGVSEQADIQQAIADELRDRNLSIIAGGAPPELTGFGDLTLEDFVTKYSRDIKSWNEELKGVNHGLELQRQIINRMHAEGGLTDRQRDRGLNQIDRDERLFRLETGTASFSDGVLGEFDKIDEALMNWQARSGEIVGGFFTNFTEGFDSVTNAAWENSRTVGEFFAEMEDGAKDLATKGLRQVINGLIQMGVQSVVAWTKEKAIGIARMAMGVKSQATVAGTTVAAMQAIGAAAAVPASLVSLATIGGNAVPAQAGIASTAALAQGLNVGAKFADGGYVRGPGGSRDDRIPARLSNGEYVVNARATRDNLDELEDINAGRSRRRRGGAVVKNVFNIQTKDADSFMESRSQLASLNVAAIRRAEERM